MTTKEEEIEKYIAILEANLAKSFNPVRVLGQRSTATAEDRARAVRFERRTSYKNETPAANADNSSSPGFEGRTRFNPESPNAFVEILNANPNLITNAAKELSKKGSSLYALCSRVTHPAVIKQMFLNSKLIDQIALEGKKAALMQKFARIRKARVIP